MSGRYLIVYWIENRKGLESSRVQRCGRSAGESNLTMFTSYEYEEEYGLFLYNAT